MKFLQQIVQVLCFRGVRNEKSSVIGEYNSIPLLNSFIMTLPAIDFKNSRSYYIIFPILLTSTLTFCWYNIREAENYCLDGVRLSKKHFSRNSENLIFEQIINNTNESQIIFTVTSRNASGLLYYQNSHFQRFNSVSTLLNYLEDCEDNFSRSCSHFLNANEVVKLKKSLKKLLICDTI